MSTSVEQALKRPLDYSKLPPQAQWNIDRSLGILDWDPTEAEVAEFTRRWNDKVQAARVAARLDVMSDSELIDQFRKYRADLNEMTGGRGTEAYLKANSIRHAWRELGRRGIEVDW